MKRMHDNRKSFKNQALLPLSSRCRALNLFMLRVPFTSHPDTPFTANNHAVLAYLFDRRSYLHAHTPKNNVILYLYLRPKTSVFCPQIPSNLRLNLLHQGIVLERHHMGLNLLHQVHNHNDNDEKRGTTEYKRYLPA